MRFVVITFVLITAATAQTPTSTNSSLRVKPQRSSAYRKLIEPLLHVPDFHMNYFEDGAADATVVCPDNCVGYPSPKPVPAVALLMKNPSVTVPLLIDCLDDARQTSIRFGGNVMTNPMKVPVGYVCLDILTWRFDHEPIADYDCAADGLQSCVNTPYYFRPDDYTACWGGCEPRPWVLVVQRNWQRALQSGALWKAQNRKLTSPRN